MHRTRDVVRWRGRVGVGMLIGNPGLGIDASAQSTTFPARPIRVVVPDPPGGLGDIFPRGPAAAIAEPLGQQIVIE